jgi:hypothetical protein
MKKLLLSVAAFAFVTVLFAQKSAADVLKFETEIINQGTLKLNDPKEVKFIVTNIGKEPLIIETATPTCGCTMGDYTKSPIAPGATGFVSAKFNAASVGHFNKTMTVKFAGIDEIKNITITGDVLSAEDYDKWVVENEAKKKAEPTTAPKNSKVAKYSKPAVTKNKN